MKISNEAVDRAASVLHDQAGIDDYWHDEIEDDARKALAAAGSLLVADELDAIAADYPADVFPSDSTEQDGDAFAGAAIREVLTRRAAELRGDTDG